MCGQQLDGQQPLLLEDRGRITESIRILVPVDRMKQKCFQITTK